MKIFFAASEMTPFAKTGGLGDVVGALPSALAELGHEVTCCVPFYRSVREVIGEGESGRSRLQTAPTGPGLNVSGGGERRIRGTGVSPVAVPLSPLRGGESGERLGAANETVAAGFSLRGRGAPIKGAATGESVLTGVLDPPFDHLQGGESEASRLQTAPTDSALLSFRVPVGNELLSAEILEFKTGAGVRVLFVRRDEFFDRSELYHTGVRDYEDNAARFIFFSKTVVELAGLDRYRPDILHCHDWQSALATVELVYRQQTRTRPTGSAAKAGQAVVPPLVKTVFTIHNLAYQGLFPPEHFRLTNLPSEFFTPRSLEFYGQLNLLKGGLVFADAITAVSPTYAKEIQTPSGGCGLDPVLRSRRDDVHGILNGADYRAWNPATDPLLKQPYGPQDLAGKRVCRADLLQRLQVTADEAAPVAAFVSRLTEQKGVDLLLQSLEDLLQVGLLVVILGKGERRYEEQLEQWARRLPGRTAPTRGAGLVVRIAHDEELSHRIQAGADLLLMPSRFEPCGLTQLYALKYGTIPVVHATGGLADTVTPFDARTGRGHGFRFTGYSEEEFIGAVQQAVSVYRQPKQWRKVMKNAMACDFSWRAAAAQYETLYKSL